MTEVQLFTVSCEDCVKCLIEGDKLKLIRNTQRVIKAVKTFMSFVQNWKLGTGHF